MTTTAQDALKIFEDGWIIINYSGMTSEQKLTHIQNHYNLKINAAKEIEANRIESENENTNANIQRTQSITESLQSIGYIVNNSIEDWTKLYNNPKRFGNNWQSQAIYQHSISPDVNYFINTASNILTEPYMINNPYLIGETFTYNGQLYEVIQSHTSQLGWTPDITLALYKKAVVVGVIADWIQPTGGHDAYNIGDKVKFNGSTYESLINANVWSPTVYAAGWKLI